MFLEVGFFAAFLAGLLSFFSPCLLPLIPGYMMFLTGSYTDDQKKKHPLVQTLAFIGGFTLIFIILGISASALGKILLSNQAFLSKISGIAIALFGLIMMDLIHIPFLTKDYRKTKAVKQVSILSAFGLGMAFAFGWTPCFGPILGSILAYTSFASPNVWHGVWLLFVYAMGLAVPFVLAALFMDFFEKKLNFLSRSSKWLKRVAGFIMILIGMLIFTGNLSRITNLFY